MIELVATGLIYRNPKPLLRSIHAWHPTLALLDNGELCTAFDLAEAISSVDYGTFRSGSSDGGETWSEPVRFFDDAADQLRTHCVRISRCRDGSLVGAGHRRYNHHPGVPAWNPETYGVEEGEWFFMRSADGVEWGEREEFEPIIADQPYELCHATLELSDGRFIIPTSLLRTWQGETPHGIKTLALVSHDSGHTWPENIDLFEDSAGEIIYHEVSVVELPDGRLLSVAWPFNAKAGRTELPVPYAIAGDGREITVRGSTDIKGETTKLLSLGDDRVLCLMRRTDKAGLWAVVAQIKGDDWINLEEAPLWQGSESHMLGERDSATELAALHFGFPNLIRLPDGDVFAAFWCREDCIHNIRWLRIRIS